VTRGPVLGSGRFIGGAAIEADTPSFAFRRMIGTVPAREVPRHSHDTAYFFFVIRGQYATEARGRSDLCGPGSLIFNPTGTTHRDHFVDDDGEFLAVSVPPHLEARIVLSIPTSTVISTPGLQTIARAAAREVNAGAVDTNFVLEGLGLQLIAGSAASARPQPTRPPDWLARVRDHLRDRSEHTLSIAEVAAEVGVHPVHLARVFRRYHGCSPGEYTRAWRVEHAKRLIAHSRLSLSDIALAAGFYDQSQFANTFKRATGLTPGAYRRRFAAG